MARSANIIEQEPDIYAFDYADEPVDENDLYAFDYDEEPEPASWGDRAADVGIDLSKGVIQLGQTVIGLGSLATGGYLSDGMRALGYDPEQSNEMLSDLYSDSRKAEEKEIAGAKGFVDTVKANVMNPGALVGKVAETAPQMLGIIATSRAIAAKVFEGAYKSALAAKATEAAAKKIALEASMKTATKAAAMAEGSMQAGGSFDGYMAEGMELGKAYVASIGSGITTGLQSFIGGSLGKKVGLGDVEAGVAAKGGVTARILKGGVQEGALEEMPQSAYEQAWDNYAHDRPLMEGVGKAMGTGLVVGAAAGGAFSAGTTGGKPDTPDPGPDQANSPRELFSPTHKAGGGQDVQPVTKNGAVIPDTYINQQGDVFRDANAVPNALPDYDPTFDVNAVAAAAKAEVGNGIVGSAMADFDVPMNTNIPTQPIEPKPTPTETIADLTETKTVEGLAAASEKEDNIRNEIGVLSGHLDTLDRGEIPEDSSFEYASNFETVGEEEYPGLIDQAKGDINKKIKSLVSQLPEGKASKVTPKTSAEVDIAANQAATSPLNERPEPGEQEKEDGSYEKGRMNLNGLPVAVESPKGSMRTGTDESGREWSVELQHHYGDIENTTGADGDPLDIFLGPDPTNKKLPVFVVNQVNPETQEFDETKTLSGFATKEEAEAAYLSNYEKNWKGLGNIVQATQKDFQSWIANGDTTKEFADVPKPKQDELKAGLAAKKPIKLGGGKSTPATDGFMKDYNAGTTPNPLDDKSRVRMNESLNTSDDFGNIEISQAGDGIALNHIQASRPGKGTGSNSLKYITDLADKHQVPITLTAMESGSKSLPQAELVKWYERNGFETMFGDRMRRMPKAKKAIKPTGKPTRVFVPSTGAELTAKVSVVEGSTLIASNDQAGVANPAYPKELQPRDRKKGSSMLQIQKIANNIKPELLDDNGQSNGGSPIVGADGVVESGNGRTLAIMRAYQENKAEGYRDYLKKNAASYGLSEADIDAMENPVLVRVRQGDMTMNERAEFARQSNQTGTAPMTPVENAQADAKRITDEDMRQYAPSEQGNTLAPSNQGFLKTFGERLGDLEVGGLSTSDGRWTKQMADRVQAAVFYKAYGDEKLLALMAEEADPDIKNILNALNQAAPAFARARAVQKDLGDLDIITDIVSAIDVVRQAKERGTSIKQLVDQAGLFGGVDPVVGSIAEFLESSARSSKRMGIGFSAMGKFLENELNNLSQDSLFDMAPATKADIVAAANRQIIEVYGDEKGIQDIFSQSEDRSEAGQRVAESSSSSREQTEDPGAKVETAKGVNDGPVVYSGYAIPKATGKDLLSVREAESGQRDLFAPSNLPEEEAHAQAADSFDVRYEQVEVSTISSGVDSVNDHGDAAHLLASIRKHAQETFMVVVTDKNNKVLNVIRHSTGTKDGASVYPIDVVGAIASTEGGKNFWMAHNHPSGMSEPSSADHSITAQIVAAAEGLGVDFHGHVVIGDGEYSYFGDPKSDGRYTRKHQIPPKPRRKKVAITERILRHKKRSDTPSLESPQQSERFIQGLESDTGILLLNNRNIPVGVLALSGAEMEKLRDGRQVRRILSAIDKTNAAAGISFIKTGTPDPAKARLLNLGNYLARLSHGFRLLDTFIPNSTGGLESAAEHHGDLGMAGRVFFRKEEQDDLFGKTESDKSQEAIDNARTEKEAKSKAGTKQPGGDDLFANDGQLEPDLFARREDPSELYEALEGKEVNYEVFVEDENKTYTVTANAANTMRAIDNRIASLKELWGCI